MNKINCFTKPVHRAFLLCIISMISYDLSYASADTVIIYYSRTGKSEAVAKAIATHSGWEVIQIKDAKERSGIWGFMGAAYDSQMGNATSIEPANIDLSMYKHVYIVTPIWNWKLSVPIRTLLHRVDLKDKKMTLVTTANIEIKKYDGFGDDAPFTKKFLRDYLRGNRKEMMMLAKSSHAEIVQHFHIATEGLSAEQIEEAAISKILKKN